jgi:3-dehydroquinate dehydratase / shikimate dehydrogenase
MIIVAVTGPGMDEALAQVEASSHHADAFEFRCDLIANADLGRLLHSTGKPRIVTYRPRWEGGEFQGDERERLSLLHDALSKGADFIDVEIGAFRGFVHLRSPDLRRTIVSHHPQVMNVGEPRRLYQRLHETGAGVVKLAFPATDAWELCHVVEFLHLARKDRRRAIAIAMGEAGEPSRVLYRVLGGWGTFAASEIGAGSAAGQLTARSMRTLYRSHQLTRQTRVFGLIGNPVRHSKGIYMHNSVFRGCRLNAVYCNFAVADLPRFMEEVAPRFHGFSVTVPHKEAMLDHVDTMSARVSAIGALNTIVRRRAGWAGENTDAVAALNSVERKIRVRGKRVLILGAGGTARALAYESVCRGATVTIANRTARRARRLARELGTFVASPKGIRSEDFDIAMNATSVGMWPDVDGDPLRDVNLRGMVVFDAVFNPAVTSLLKHAERDGAVIVSGIEMYIQQAIEQDQLFVNKRPVARTLRRVLQHLL